MLGFLRGKSGELRAGYQCAAALGRWTAKKDTDGGWTVEAKAKEVHSFWINSDRLAAALCFGNGVRWRWPKVQIINRDGMLLFRVIGVPDKRG